MWYEACPCAAHRCTGTFSMLSSFSSSPRVHIHSHKLSQKHMVAAMLAINKTKAALPNTSKASTNPTSYLVCTALLLLCYHHHDFIVDAVNVASCCILTLPHRLHLRRMQSTNGTESRSCRRNRRKTWGTNICSVLVSFS